MLATRLEMPGEPTLHLQVQRSDATKAANSSGAGAVDVLYVHGATFPSDLSIFFRFDGRSWADALNEAGFNAWGLDFAGYGRSDKYARTEGVPVGRIDDVVPQLARAVEAIRQRNGGRPIVMVAHSWGTAVAARYASQHPEHLKQLILFGPPVKRSGSAVAPAQATAQPEVNPLPALYPLSVWAQYRRFVEDVPRGEPQVLSEAHMQAWGAAFLATDALANTRFPPAVLSPSGPIADIGVLWDGGDLYNAAAITTPTLIVRGAWDSVCNDNDAAALLQALGSKQKKDLKIPRATHLMHLEVQRHALYKAVNDYLLGVLS